MTKGTYTRAARGIDATAEKASRMRPRLAVIVSHPIQHFAPWYREVARKGNLELRVFFCCDWGLASYTDPEFLTTFEWDIPLVDGYAHEFLPIRRRPTKLTFSEVDNPSVGAALDRFDPDVILVFGYAHRTNWRAARWARARRRPVLLYSDSNARAKVHWLKSLIKESIVQRFYNRVDGALFVGDNNRAYHVRYGLPEERLFPGVLPIERSRLLGAVADRQAVRTVTRRRLGIPEGAFVVLFSGKYSPRKRPLDLVSAAWSASQNGLPVWSILVGEGSERSVIDAFCKRHKVTNTVLTGFVNQSDIPAYYASADALAVTSSFDPHPLAVTEGASFGLPILASDQIGCIGANDTAQPGTNAIVYPCGDSNRLQSEIATLCRDRVLYARMSEASVRISERQDVPTASASLLAAAEELRKLGPRQTTTAWPGCT